MAKFFRFPFAVTGSRSDIPATSGDGTINYQDGYPVGYSLPSSAGAASKKVERLKWNQLMYDITSAIQQLQVNGFPNFITSADNGGTPYSYSIRSIVRFDDGTGFKNYESLIDSNTTTPANTANWRVVDTSGASTGNIDGGSANSVYLASQILSGGNASGV